MMIDNAATDAPIYNGEIERERADQAVSPVSPCFNGDLGHEQGQRQSGRIPCFCIPSRGT